jgi:hypothetical protein
MAEIGVLFLLAQGNSQLNFLLQIFCNLCPGCFPGGGKYAIRSFNCAPTGAAHQLMNSNAASSSLNKSDAVSGGQADGNVLFLSQGRR